MKNDFIAEQSIIINAPAAKVWDALINPEKIKKYLFGTEAVSEWKKGSQIRYRGEWQGKSYEDKGMIINIIPEKLLVSTYWSSMSGLPDMPENYNKVTYKLKPENGRTVLTVIQDNNPTEESKKHAEQNWKTVIEGLKDLVEKE